MEFPSKTISEAVPLGWGGDRLTEFFDLARQNQKTSFVMLPRSFKVLIEIDACFHLASENLHHPQELLCAIFLQRTHAAFRAACSAAAATTIPEAFVLLRSCLEYSGYAVHIFKNPSLVAVWSQRHTSESGIARMRRDFLQGRIESSIFDCDRDLKELYVKLYQKLIDFGAHPNYYAVASSLRIHETPGGHRLQPTYLQDDIESIGATIKTVAQVGLCCLHLLQHVFSARFLLLGLRDRIADLKKCEAAIDLDLQARTAESS